MFYLTANHLTAAVCVHLFHQKALFKRHQQLFISIDVEFSELHYRARSKSKNQPVFITGMFY